MTEDEAKTKWCPYARYFTCGPDVFIAPDGRFPVVSDTEIVSAPQHCIGSACAMWRTFQQNGKEGYCGLAGKP